MTIVSALDKPETFQTWARNYYHPIAESLYDAAVGRMLRELRPPPGGTVLDAGCGTGVHSVRVARAGFHAYGVDISRAALGEAGRRARQAGVSDRVTFERADLLHLPFADEAFDAVFSWGVIVHIPDVSSALAELIRVTAPGGRIALQVTNCKAWEGAAEKAARLCLNKPARGQERRHFGTGGWCQMHGGRLYNWRMDVPNVIQEMRDRGCRPVHRSAVEFTELQRRLPGPLRAAALRLNNAYLAIRLPAGPASTNLLVFEKAPRAVAAATKPRIVYHLPAATLAMPRASNVPQGPRTPHTPRRLAGLRVPGRWSQRSPIVQESSFRES